MTTTQPRPFAPNNTTVHVLVEFTDGETIPERHRDTFGGFNNLIDRIAARDGIAHGRTSTRATTGPDGRTVFTLRNGRTFTIDSGWSA